MKAIAKQNGNNTNPWRMTCPRCTAKRPTTVPSKGTVTAQTPKCIALATRRNRADRFESSSVERCTAAKITETPAHAANGSRKRLALRPPVLSSTNDIIAPKRHSRDADSPLIYAAFLRWSVLSGCSGPERARVGPLRRRAETDPRQQAVSLCGVYSAGGRSEVQNETNSYMRIVVYRSPSGRTGAND